MTGFPIACIGSLNDLRAFSLLLPYLFFVLLISFLGHKEWRFIIYTVPAFNVAAARGLNYLYVFFSDSSLTIPETVLYPFLSTSRRKATVFGQISFLAALAAIAANASLTGILLRTSMLNYPGGTAIATFHELLPTNTTRKPSHDLTLRPSHSSTAPAPPHVHICNLAAQSGTTLFHHLHAPPYHPALLLWPNTAPPMHPWTYNKTENLTIADLSTSSHFTHLISEVPPTEPEITKHWRLMKSIPAFDGVTLDEDLLLRKPQELPWRIRTLIKIEQKDQLWIYERK